MIFLYIFCLFLLFISFLLFLYLNRNVFYWKKRNFPYLKPLLCVGHIGSVLIFKKSIGDRIGELYRQTNGPFIGFFTLDQPALLIRDRELARNILVKDFNYFADCSFSPNEKLEPISGQGLFAVKGQKWRKLRALQSTGFSSAKLRNIFFLIREQTECVNSLLVQCIENDLIFNPKDIYSRYTTDVITNCAFGLNAGSIENPKAYFREIGRQLFEPTISEAIILGLTFTAPWILETFHLRVKNDDYYDMMRKVIWGTIEYRQKNRIRRNDLLDLLIELREKTLAEKEKDPNTIVVDGDTLVAQAFVFLIGGFETSSFTITMTLYEFALNSEVQEKAREDVRTVLQKDKELTYDNIKEMKYVKKCIDETLRKYPPLTFLDRICTKDYQIPGTTLTIEKGITVFVPVGSFHYDPEVFPDPGKYIPERFSEEKLSNYKLNYYPFGEGPRICIGMQFGIMQTMAALAHFLNKYRVEPCALTPIPVKFNKKNFNLTVNEIPLKLVTCN